MGYILCLSTLIKEWAETQSPHTSQSMSSLTLYVCLLSIDKVCISRLGRARNLVLSPSIAQNARTKRQEG